MKSIEIDSGGPLMPRSKSRAIGEVGSEARIFEVTHAGRTHARARELVVKPRRSAAAEIRADRLVQRRE